MGHTEHIDVELPADQAEQIRRLVDARKAESVSSYVADAVAARLHRDRSLTELRELFDRKGQSPSPEHLAWARDVLGVGDEDDGDKDRT